MRSVVEDMVSAEPGGVPWSGIDSPPGCRATQVDRLFAFVEERRVRCCTCSSMRQEFRRDVVMELPVPAGGPDVASLTELYLQRCASRSMRASCTSKTCGGVERDHEEQSRLLHLPAVLLVQLCRESTSAPFAPEEHVSFASCGSAELVAVVYETKGANGSKCFACAS